MKAVGFTFSHPVEHPESLIDFDMAKPAPGEYDLLVKVAAVSVNPADAKLRIRTQKDSVRETPRVLGFDAVGTVEAVGAKVSGFKAGDRVYYAGDITRPGSNAEYQVIDARIAAKAPTTLGDAEAAALPLTTLTGWEALFDRMRIDPAEEGKTLLIIGGAGGVGSIATQIAKQTTKLTVIATASRPETSAFVKEMGADYVANHRDLVKSVRALGFETVDYIFNTADTSGHWDAMVDLIAPQGIITCIVESEGGIALAKLSTKSAGFFWEWMFTRAMYKTRDISRQHEILSELAALVDAGRIKSTLTETLQGLNAATFRRAHEMIESGKSIGKIAIVY